MSSTMLSQTGIWIYLYDSGVSKLEIPATVLPDLVKQIHFLNFNIVASSALFFWDLLLNLNKEVSPVSFISFCFLLIPLIFGLIYIWKFEFSYMTVLFGVIRFLVIGVEIMNLLFNVGTSGISDSGCRVNLWLAAVFGLIISTCVDVLLIFRVYALYGKNKALFTCLCALEAVVFMTVACLIALALPKIQSVADPFSRQLPTVICIVLKTPNIESYIWLPILVAQATLFLLALGRHIYLQRNGLRFFGRTSHVYHTFIRDGIWVFFVLLAGFLLSIIGFSLHSILGQTALYWNYSLMGISASHLIINLRSASHEAGGRLLKSLPVSYTGVQFINKGTELSRDVSTGNTCKDFDYRYDYVHVLMYVLVIANGCLQFLGGRFERR